MCGDGSKKDTPVPMPNTAVKLLSADGSWTFGPVRVGRCHALYSPEQNPSGSVLFLYRFFLLLYWSDDII